MKIPVLHTSNGRFWMTLLSCAVSAIMLTFASATVSLAAKELQTRFRSADEAVEALVAATRTVNLKAIQAILGPGSKELISSGDSVSDNAGRGKFVAAYEQKHFLRGGATGAMILHIGADDWPMPIPIIKKGEFWGFDISRGKIELLNRRIGRNELHVIEVINEYVAAQHEYASKDCRGGGKVEFAQRIISSPGSHDGLYWEAGEDKQQSPLGPLLARAAQEGYTVEGNLSPFHGYYFKILKGQGKYAKGGAYNYVSKDRMILGFGLVAYPAEYGNSGIMTFMVNQEGVILEKDLGKNSRRLAESITEFNPGKSWKKVKPLEAAAKKESCPDDVKKQ